LQKAGEAVLKNEVKQGQVDRRLHEEVRKSLVVGSQGLDPTAIPLIL
jgi:hypothetical protein